MDLKQHLIRQMVFSRATFGPGARTEGVLDHIGKEIEEVRKSGGSPDEWVDLVILSLDGLTRELRQNGMRMRPGLGQLTGMHLDDIEKVAEIACELIRRKQGRNELRDWPDWRTADPNKAIEHNRDEP